MLKHLSGLPRSAIESTRRLLGKPGARPVQPVVIPRAEHPVSRKNLSKSAVKVLYRLREGGHSAYLVGGGVRDALVGLTPKDFDVATDASPEEVKALFRNSRIIGRRFRLVHVVFGREVIEVATFRAAHDAGEGGEVGASGRIVRDNVYGNIEQDALRRDFSVNALYYNIEDFSLVDYAGGMADIQARVFRLIGEPVTRCEEDPVRVLRAVRLAAKLEFDIHVDTLAAMRQTAERLADVPPARLFEEVLKLFQGGYAQRSFAAVVEHDLLQYLFPLLAQRLGDPIEAARVRPMLDAALANTDRRVDEGKPITPAYLLAFMLWPDVEQRASAAMDAGENHIDALHLAADSVMAEQLRSISIPRRYSGPMRDIWLLQPRLELNTGARALALLENKRFRAAYDFMHLRALQSPELAPLARWWTRLQTLEPAAQEVHLGARPELASNWARGAGKRAGGSKRTDKDTGTGTGKPRNRRRRRPRTRKPPEA